MGAARLRARDAGCARPLRLGGRLLPAQERGGGRLRHDRVAGGAALVQRSGGHGRHLLHGLGAVGRGDAESAASGGDVGQSGGVQRADLVAAAGRRARAALAGLGLLERARLARGGGGSGALRRARPGRGGPARLARSSALAAGRHAALADQGLRALGDRSAHPGDGGGLALAAAEHEFRALRRADRRCADRLQRRLVRLLHAGHDRIVRRVHGGQVVAAVPADGPLDARRGDAGSLLVGRCRLRTDGADQRQSGRQRGGAAHAVLRSLLERPGVRLAGRAAGADLCDGRRQRAADRVGAARPRRRVAR